MPEQTLAARLKKQFDDDDLTEREKVRLVRIVDECIERYAKVRDIQKKLLSVGSWVEAATVLQASLQKLNHYAVEIPLEILAVIDNGPKETLDFFGPRMMAALCRRFGTGGFPQNAFVEVAKVGLLFLSELRAVLQETKPKGEPGRPFKYPKKIVEYVRKLRAKRAVWKDVLQKCKDRFKDVVFSQVKVESFAQEMRRRLAE